MTRSRRPGIGWRHGGALVVRLCAAPVEGAANEELVSVLSEALGVPRRAVAVVSGARSRIKRVRIEGLSSERAYSRLEEAARD